MEKEKNTGIFTLMMVLHGFGAIVLVILMISSLIGFLSELSWWVYLILLITTMLLGYTWYVIGENFDKIYEEINKLKNKSTTG